MIGANSRHSDSNAGHPVHVEREGKMVDSIVFAGRFFFNVTAAVGTGQPNRLDDVELVRFGYKMQRKDPRLVSRPGTAARQQLADKMNGTGPFAPDLQAVITAHEIERGGAQDGRVTPAQHYANIDGTYDHQHIWIIMALNNAMRFVAKDIYPRIDLHIESGSEVSRVVRGFFLVKGT